MGVYIIVVFIFGLVVAGLGYFFLDQFVNSVYTMISTQFPTYFTGLEWVFSIRLWNWAPILIVLIPLLIWVITNSMREAEEARL